MLNFSFAEFDFIGMVGHKNVQSGNGLLQIFSGNLDSLSTVDLLVLGVRVLYFKLKYLRFEY